jgi:two-component system NtrC family response regulator
MARVLLIDDDAGLREVLAFVLTESGHDVSPFAGGAPALAAFGVVRPEVVITDLKMPGIDGMEILGKVSALDPTVPVIILTAFGTIEDAVEAMKQGAYHYLTKPYNREELRLAVDQALAHRRLLLENKNLRDRLHEQTRRIEFIHVSAAMQAIVQMIRRVAASDATVLITGESGTGKEIVAQSLHSHSERWERHFVAVNCAAIPRDLMESELFGHVRGAFTGAVKDKPGRFQRADGGTIFLDEIADLPPDLQTKLLRVIETGEVDVVGGQKPVQVDVRLVAATNADLAARVREERFRSDLYYRLNVIPIHIPPLRDRVEDIPALWGYFVGKHAGTATVRTDPPLLRALMRRRWPGNVRELVTLSQRMVLLRSGDALTIADLPPETDESRDGPDAAAGQRRAAGQLTRIPRGRWPALKAAPHGCGARAHRPGFWLPRRQPAHGRIPRDPPSCPPLPDGEVRNRVIVSIAKAKPPFPGLPG